MTDIEKVKKLFIEKYPADTWDDNAEEGEEPLFDFICDEAATQFYHKLAKNNETLEQFLNRNYTGNTAEDFARCHEKLASKYYNC